MRLFEILMLVVILPVLVWLLALALPYFLPVPQFPDVTGPYAIGTQTFYLVDESRSEIYTDDPADKREIMMQVWYPAEPDAQGETAVYPEALDVMGPALAERLNLPSFLLDHINLAQPFLFLRADLWEFNDSTDNHTIAETLYAGLDETGYLTTITGAAHFDFTDIPLLSPLTPQLNLSSDMDSAYVVEMMNSMTSAFFRQELQGADEDLVQEAMVYPEMELVGNGR